VRPLVLTIALLAVLAGCGKEDSPRRREPILEPRLSATDTPAPTTPQIKLDANRAEPEATEAPTPAIPPTPPTPAIASMPDQPLAEVEQGADRADAKEEVDPEAEPIIAINETGGPISIRLVSKENDAQFTYEVASGEKKLLRIKKGRYGASHLCHERPGRLFGASESILVDKPEQWVFKIAPVGGLKRHVAPVEQEAAHEPAAAKAAP